MKQRRLVLEFPRYQYLCQSIGDQRVPVDAAEATLKWAFKKIEVWIYAGQIRSHPGLLSSIVQGATPHAREF